MKMFGMGGEYHPAGNGLMPRLRRTLSCLCLIMIRIILLAASNLLELHMIRKFR